MYSLITENTENIVMSNYNSSRHTRPDTSTRPEDKYYERYRRSRGRSPSKRRPSSVTDDNEKLTITNQELDDLIVSWNDVRNEMKSLRDKERKYKQLITRVMSVTRADVIKGRDLQVIKKIQTRKTVSSRDLPIDIFEKYSNVKEIPVFYIRELNYSQ